LYNKLWSFGGRKAVAYEFFGLLRWGTCGRCEQNSKRSKEDAAAMFEA
jgi:hypothetical protein